MSSPRGRSLRKLAMTGKSRILRCAQDERSLSLRASASERGNLPVIQRAGGKVNVQSWREIASQARDNTRLCQKRYSQTSITTHRAIITNTIATRMSVDQPQAKATCFVASQASFCFFPKR